MNYNHLFYFHVIAQEGSIARASRRLHVSQPTLSEQLKQLELYFDTKFFDRKGGAMRLNNQGRRALRFTESIFDIGDRLVQTFHENPEKAKIRLDIGVVTTCARSIMMDKLVELFKDDSIIVRIRQGDNQYLAHELITSGLDILITDTLPHQADDRGVESRVILSPKLVVIGSTEKMTGDCGEDIPAALHGQPFIHYTTQSSYRWEIDQYLRELCVEPSIVAEADDVYIIREAVRSGIGFGVVPQSIVRRKSELEGIEIIGDLGRNFETYALYSKKDPTAETLRALGVLTGSGEASTAEKTVGELKP
ncbi:LysR family transcriptional regulator [bacterium]|nr:LysR family transcriptional regulator [bacterium]